MNFLDMKTVLLTMLATDILCTVVLIQLWRQSRERFAGTHLWVLDYLCLTAAVLLILLRGIVPDWMSMVLANTLTLTGALFGYIGLERFLGEKSSQRHNYILLAAFVLIHSYLTLVQPDLRLRSMNISAALLIICCQCTWLMLVRVPQHMRSLTRAVGLVFGTFCLVNAFRILWLSAKPSLKQDYFNSGATEILIHVLYQLLLILLAYGLSLMVNKRLLMGIKNEEEKFSKAFHFSPNAITLTRLSDGKVFEVNQGFMDLTGYTHAEVLGKTSLDQDIWRSEEDREALIEELIRGGCVRNKDEQFKTRTGETRTGLVSGEIITINNEKCILSSIVDITDLKRAEEERLRLEQRLQQAQKAQSLGRMAGAVAHNFNNLLAAVIGNLELALYNLPQGSDPQPAITRAMAASKQAADVSGFMLTYLGQTTGKPEPVDLVWATEEACASLTPSIPKGVHLKTRFPAEKQLIRADADHVTQILSNLVSNAVEAIGEREGSIELTIDMVEAGEFRALRFFPQEWEPRAKSYARLTVADSGEGMDSATQQNIFDPYFSTRFTGRGLGLSVVMGLVRTCGGAISLESRPGEGSTFQVFFPLLEHQTTRVAGATMPPPPPSCVEGTVLLVDDEPFVRSMAKSMLETILGYEVVEACDGSEALEIFRVRKDEISLVILDLSMPGMNGWETLSALRNLRPDIPVILSSGYNEAQVRQESHREQPQAFLHKPYRLNDLKSIISQALERLAA
ncbi:MAG: response regulator [Syntrophobacteraceae bacterium]